MKVQFNGLCSLIGSKNLSKEVKDAALASPEGKQKLLEVTLTDEDGQEFTFRVKPQLFSTGTLGGRLTLKGEARVVVVDRAASREETKEQKRSAMLTDLESQLLS